MPVERLLYRPAEAAAAIGVSRSRMYELIASGEIPSLRIGGSLRVPVDPLRRWVEQQVAEWKTQRRDRAERTAGLLSGMRRTGGE